MRVTELIKDIGKDGVLALNGWKINVKILDARTAVRDTVEYEVIPISGEGKQWVSSALIQIKSDPK